MKEIGSEFWLDKTKYNEINLEIPTWLNWGMDNKLLLSGRTAIDYVLKDILKNNKINTVYFPVYCCQSMLQPFIDNGINIIFYNVDFDGEKLIFNIDTTQECDIFYAMNYFGFAKGRIDRYIEIFKQRNIFVIEDATHSLLSMKSFNNYSDYIVASLRKWIPVLSGGLAVKTYGIFEIQPKEETLEEMVRIRKLAMLDKARFMNGDKSIVKAEFLNKYSIANELLNKEYSLYSIDKKSYQIISNTNFDSIIKRRRENVKTLYKELQENKRIKLVFPALDSEDCPIFIPIIFDSIAERNALRGHLTNNNVYCPVHWPKPTILNKNKTTSIYDYELSLVVDQRYDKGDMKYLLRRLKEFYE